MRVPNARRLRFVELEPRITPTTDLILDFDGGTVQTGKGYQFPSGFGTTFTAFPGFNGVSAGERAEQIEQIVAGVRQDFADFDVRVLWDDRGANSPVFDAKDTVVMIVAEDGGPFGISPTVDLTQATRDVAFAFYPTHIDTTQVTPPLPWRRIRELTDTISHEAGHTFGLSHSTQSDAQQRQLTTTASQNTSLDSRFSITPLNHGAPETGVVYAEATRLTTTLGAAPAGANLTTSETVTNQALSLDTNVATFNTTRNISILSGSVTSGSTTSTLQIDYAGDRDAIRVTFSKAGTYALRERAAGSSIDPVLTVFDSNGFLKADGSVGAVGGVSLATVTVAAGDTLYLVAGTGYDRTASGVVGTPTRGKFNLEVTPSWAEFNSVTNNLTITADNASGHTIALTVAGADVAVTYDAQTLLVASAGLAGITITGGTGIDTIALAPVGLPAVSADGGGGADTLTLTGTAGDDSITIYPNQAIVAGGPTISLSNIPAITLVGLAGNDTFGVQPSASVAVTVTGGAPSTTPGDHLSVPTGGTLVGTLPDGSLTFPGTQPIIFTGIETITDDLAPPPLPPVAATRIRFAVGSGETMVSTATLYQGGVAQFTVSPYDRSFRGGVRVAAGDVNGDGIADLITAAGPGGGPHIRVFDGATGAQIDGPLGSFYAYGPTFAGGVYLAAADVNGDGFADIITGAGAGGGPHVRVFSGADGSELQSFYAFDPKFGGGVRVAAGDFNGDRQVDIATAAGPGGGPHVQIFDGKTLAVVSSFYAFDASFSGGVYISAGDANGDGIADLAAGMGEGGDSLVRVRDIAMGQWRQEFLAYTVTQTVATFELDKHWTAGVRIALADVDGDGIAELVTAPGYGMSSQVRIRSLATLDDLIDLTGDYPAYRGGFFVG